MACPFTNGHRLLKKLEDLVSLDFYLKFLPCRLNFELLKTYQKLNEKSLY